MTIDKAVSACRSDPGPIPGWGDLPVTAQAAGVKDVPPTVTAVGESPVISGFRLLMVKSLPGVIGAAHFN